MKMRSQSVEQQPHKRNNTILVKHTVMRMRSSRPLITMDECTTTIATVAAYFKITLRRLRGTEAVRARLCI